MIIENSIHRKLRSFVQVWKEMHHDRTTIGLWSVALLTGSMGLVNLWSSVFPGDPTRLEWLDFFMPIEIRAEAHIFSAMCGFLL